MCNTDQKTIKTTPRVATGDRAILPEGAQAIPVYIMGKRYEVPETLTIMKAMEFAGFKFLRGAGCRGGICGACPTVSGWPGIINCTSDWPVRPWWQLICILPRSPFIRPTALVTVLRRSAVYRRPSMPFTRSCFVVSLATNAPRPARWMSMFLVISPPSSRVTLRRQRDCLLTAFSAACAASRCLGEIPQYHIAMLARRVYGKYILPRAERLKARARAIEDGRYETMLSELSAMSRGKTQKRYVEREREPDFAERGSWQPQDAIYNRKRSILYFD